MGTKSPEATVDTLILELLSQDSEVEMGQLILCLAGIGASAVLVLSQQTGRTTEELLDGFAEGFRGWSSDAP